MDIQTLFIECSKFSTASIDEHTLKRIERCKQLAAEVEAFANLFQKSPEEAAKQYGTRTLKLIAMRLTSDLDYIREDVSTLMKHNNLV